jgi:uncharacterized membrane protein
VPLATGWMGEHHFASLPAALYGTLLLASAIAYKILQDQIVRLEGPDSKLARAVGRDVKGKISPVLYLVAIPLAFVQRWAALGIYVLVAIMWLVPDPRIESHLEH